ncbi:N-acetylated-alpha-linked acidic dipeptidase 2-like [Plakobranchus ocellatus]|uniref:N-acetylated-alpha-linked acidic dipeptidase 2-like n=1 Tax=Plakobranchus ocellatus TaxID=259542 RepID=A0AAV4DYY9_9GAST|nr:N-acetylated-alpha-linked acidic dipeptidase 2-like [Plakobranchus ocellatus]
MTPFGPMSNDDGSDVNTSRSHLVSPARPFNCSTSRVTLLIIVTSALTLTAGLLLGRFAIPRDDDDEVGVFLLGAPQTLMESGDLDVAQKILDGIEAGKIEENLRLITAKPHIADRQADFELVDLLKTRFQEYGLQVQVTPYDVLLSYPSDSVPNSVRLLDGDREVIYDAAGDESDLSEQPGVVRPFHAYSPARLVEVNIVPSLVSQDWNGRHSPAEYTGMRSGDTRVYPETWWLPPDGVQRGNIFSGDGDPLTPGYPANS